MLHKGYLWHEGRTFDILWRWRVNMLTHASNVVSSARPGQPLFPCFVKHAILGKLGHPAPEWSRRETDAVVVVAVDLFYQDAAQTLKD